MSPGGGDLGTETPPRVSWGQWFHLFFLITFYHHDAPAPSPGSWGEFVCCV
jgi:hypothetical protein